MSTTLITSCLSLFSITIGGFIVSNKIKKGNKKSDQLLSSVWFFIGITFFFITLRTFLFSLGYFKSDYFFAHITQLFIIPYYFVFSRYIIYESINNKILKYFIYSLVIILSLAFTILLIKDGLVGPFISDWGSEYSASYRANLAIIMSGILAFIFLLYSFLNQIFKYFKNKNNFNYKKFLSYLSLIIFITVVIFEQLGNIGWLILFLRIFILFSILIIYLAYDKEKYEIKN